MRLFDYQEDAVDDLAAEVEAGWEGFERRGRLSAIALSAPTAAGKTVIATALLGRLFLGDEQTAPHADLTVLWVTDDPSLNEQTRRKMLKDSFGIRVAQLVKVTQQFDQETFDKGKIYFMHIQQLGSGASNYLEKGEAKNRRWSLWETIANTIQQRPKAFLLVVDEAHRGTKAAPGGRKTIIGRLTDGAGGELPAAPIVIGITATPDNFIRAMTSAGSRTLSTVPVDPARVRASGLIKDKIGLNHPKETQPGDITLLQTAVEQWQEFSTLWQRYSDATRAPSVHPILAIQLQPAISDRDLASVLVALNAACPDLVGAAVAHAFQDHVALDVGGQTVRYLAPEDIQDDPDVRAVLFKEALTTGWDCPRAEVLISFRKAKDATYIAQLVGRMVRTPLAKRITTDDVLNTVGLYLPHFAEKELDAIVKHLEGDESAITAQVERDLIACPKNEAIAPEVWEVFCSLPTYTRPSRTHRSEIGRLNRLALLLESTGLLEDATGKARAHIVGLLELQATRLGATLDERVEDLANLEYQRILVDMASGERTYEQLSRATSLPNIDDLFKNARRVIGDAGAKWFWNHLCSRGTDPDEAKLRVAALSQDRQTVDSLEEGCAGLISTWRQTHNGQITTLDASKRDEFYAIWQQSTTPEEVLLLPKEQLTAPANETTYAMHLYKPVQGEFPVKGLNDWERTVLTSELSRPSIVGWYRNPTGGRDALGVPYEMSGEPKTSYPDFLFFHKDGDRIVVDIVDPSDPDRSNCGPKWAGLSKFAQTHQDRFRSVRAVVREPGGQLLSLDLFNPLVLDRMERCSNQAEILSVFSEFGGNY